MSGVKPKSGGTKVVFVKKKAKGHGHHGGAWKVAYADFVTSMMAFFMVLWLVSQTDHTTQSALAQYFRTGVFDGAPHLVTGGAGVQAGGPTDPSMARPVIDERALQGGAERMQDLLRAAAEEEQALRGVTDRVQVRVVDEGLLIEITDGGDELLFELSSAALSPVLQGVLRVIAPVLASLHNPIEIHGHTDARPFAPGSTRTNWDLSFERADNARRMLAANGVDPGQIVGILAHGASHLAVPDDPLSPANRRLTILARRLPSAGPPVEHAAAPAPEPGAHAPGVETSSVHLDPVPIHGDVERPQSSSH